MENIIVLAIVVLIVGTAIFWIRREKKKGARCIGCPNGGDCTGHCSGCEHIGE